MIKKILIVTLIAVVVIAAGFSAYNVWAQGGTQPGSGTPGSGQGGGYGRGQGGGQGGGMGRGRGGQGGQGSQTGSGVPNPQNGLTEWVTLQGTVSNITAQGFTLTAANGTTTLVELGNQSYVAKLGLTLQDGASVTVKGFTDMNGGLAVGTITLDASGQSFTLRDELGRPAWRGGGQGGGQGAGQGGPTY